MSVNPLHTLRPAATAKRIPSLSDPSALSDPTATRSSFGGSLNSSSVSRKKPLGLEISKSIKPTRTAPALPGEDGVNGTREMSESEKLRQDIEKLQNLQLASRSSSSSPSLIDSPVDSSPTGPTTPNHLSASGLDGPTAGARKKSASSVKSRKRDKDGEDLVKDEDLEILCDLGAGNGGTVAKVWNKKRNCIMARKLIFVDAKPSVRKQILRELQIMNDCASPYIVGYYGCFPHDINVGIVMEYMDAGSLDYIYRRSGAIPIQIVGKVAEAVLQGLLYLYDVHRIIHRDIKPSNILANTAGEIKICDFGVSGELINSIANTFVGTSTYMSPERIQGAPYTIKSDVWSLGISLIELACGRFPFSDPPDSSSEAGSSAEEGPEYDPDATLPLSTQPPKLGDKKKSKKGDKKERRHSKGVSLGGGGHTMSILDLLQHIVNEPAPKLVSSRRHFPEEAVGFVDWCLNKDPGIRQSPQELLASQWSTKSAVTIDDLKLWAESVV